MLERFAQFAQQPCVLDRDDGLGGEVLHQFALLVGERPDFLAVDDDGTDQFVLFAHRHGKQRSDTGDIHGGHKKWIARDVTRLRHQVWGLYRLPGGGETTKSRIRTRADRCLGPSKRIGWRRIVHRCSAERAILVEEQITEAGTTDLGGLLQQALENRLKLARRGADDSQYVGRGGLLFQRLPQFTEQPRVLDGDNGLRGEIHKEIYLLAGKGSDFLTVNYDGADEFVVLQHRYQEMNSCPGKVDKLHKIGIARFVSLLFLDIGDMEHLLGSRDLSKRHQRTRSHDRIAASFLGKLLGYAVHRNSAESAVFSKPQEAIFGLADARRILQHGLEDGLKVAWRRADHAQHICRRRLLLQRLFELVEQPRVLDGDDCLRGKILYKLNLFIGERPIFLAVNAYGADQLVIFEHRSNHETSSTGKFNQIDGIGIALLVGSVSCIVLNVDQLLRRNRSSKRAPRARIKQRSALAVFGKCSRHIVHRGDAGHCAFLKLQYAEISRAQPRGVRQYGVENGLKRAWGA